MEGGLRDAWPPRPPRCPLPTHSTPRRYSTPADTQAGDLGANDTAFLFNWHPLLMTGALALFAEAALTFRAPLVRATPRPARKAAHAAAHATGLVLAAAGVAAAVASHVLKRPEPIPNLYSPHALVGAAACCLLLLQAALGAAAFLSAAASPDARAAFAPAHRLAGRAALGAGVAAALMGLAEKSAFVQVAGHAPVRSAKVALPVTVALCLASLGGCLVVVLGSSGSDGRAGNSGDGRVEADGGGGSYSLGASDEL